MTASLTNPVAPAATAALRVAGAVVAYRLHDVGYALDLERAARLVERRPRGGYARPAARRRRWSSLNLR
jgi:hypothetical protein